MWGCWCLNEQNIWRLEENFWKFWSLPPRVKLKSSGVHSKRWDTLCRLVSPNLSFWPGQGLSLTLELIHLNRPVSSGELPFSTPPPPSNGATGVCQHTRCLHGSWDLNSGPPACVARTFPNKPVPCYLIFIFPCSDAKQKSWSKGNRSSLFGAKYECPCPGNTLDGMFLGKRFHKLKKNVFLLNLFYLVCMCCSSMHVKARTQLTCWGHFLPSTKWVLGTEVRFGSK